MKRTVILALGTLGAASAAGFIAAAPASAEECGEQPIGLTPGNIVCNIVSNGSSFAMSVDPARNINILFNGTADNPELGLVNQPATFVGSVQRFFSGPIAPDGPPDPATPPA